MVTKSMLLLFREAKRGQSCLSGAAGRGKKQMVKDEAERRAKLSWWMPHQRSGIYYPIGHEWVMEDVPEGAASSDFTYWLRDSEGVELDHPSNDSSLDGY